ncbi:MAG: glycosyltransferase family 2 protein [Acidobacteriota bacterium]
MTHEPSSPDPAAPGLGAAALASPDDATRRGAAPRVTLAMPVYGEEALIDELVARCAAVLDATPGGPHQIVIVNDGSRDGTLAKLEAAAQREPRLLVVDLSRNYGHQTAMTAALDHATGDVILAMDGDLQDPPEELPNFLERWRAGYDVVYARRVRRKEGLFLRTSYFLFYRLLASVSDLEMPLDSGDFALLSRRALDALRAAPERQRYIRGLRAWVGFPQTGLEVERHARSAGESKYSLVKLMGLAFDGIFAFSTVPLRLATTIGVVTILLTGLYAAYALFARIVFEQVPRGFTASLLILVFVSGVQLVFLGVLGEYVGRIYEEVKRRPHYYVQRWIGSSPPARSPQAPGGSPAEHR